MPSEEILSVFGHKLRVRVCGICLQDNQLLLVNLRNVTHHGNLWCPPGGGMQFGESAEVTLKREFLEETGLEVDVGKLLFVNEFRGNSLHAIELFFRVTITGGTLQKGYDPELQTQVLTDIGFFTFEHIQATYSPNELHNLFRYCHSIEELLAMQGYYKLNLNP